MKTKFIILLSIFVINCRCIDKSEKSAEKNDSFSKSGFYLDKVSKKYFYKYKYYGINHERNDEGYISVPVLCTNGDTLKEIDIPTFRFINDFYVDKKYFFKIISQADYLSVIADSIKNIDPGCYYEKSYYVSNNDSIFYESPDGKACNGFLKSLTDEDSNLNYKKKFNVLDIENFEHDCALVGNILIVNGCIVKNIEDLELNNYKKNLIMSAIKFKKFKKAYCY